MKEKKKNNNKEQLLNILIKESTNGRCPLVLVFLKTSLKTLRFDVTLFTLFHFDVDLTFLFFRRIEMLLDENKEKGENEMTNGHSL